MPHHYSALNPDERLANTNILCDYSRAAQSACEPLEKGVGGLCGCTLCLTSSVVVCTVICCAAASGATNVEGAETACCKIGNVGNQIGSLMTRTAVRLLGLLIGILYYPCEKLNRNKASTKFAGNPHTLFCCPISKDKLQSVHYASPPADLFDTTDPVTLLSPPSRQFMP